VGEGVLEQRIEHRGARAPAASGRSCRHAPDAPTARLSVGRDQPDRHELVRVERAHRECVRGLARGDLLERFVRSQHGLPQRPRLLERRGPHDVLT
jgi:hypothetical protein